MTDSDSEADTEGVPATTFLPDHFLSGPGASERLPVGEPTGTTRGGDDEETADDETADGERVDDAAGEFCRTWRSHLSGGSSLRF
jgi:hypothetical protein